MKHLNLTAGLLALLLLGPAMAQTATNPSAAQLEAESVVNRYLDALLQGDTITLRSLLGGRLATTRQSLLSNPDYSAHLIQRYQGATVKLRDAFTTGDGVAVDVEIVLGNHDTLHPRFLLERETHPGDPVPQFYIVGETTPGAPR